jgi:hypothetical protein
MKTITIEAMQAKQKAKRNKIGVADKLHSFLTSKIATFKKNEAYTIEASDFLTDVNDFHYYTSLKMLEATKLNEKLNVNFNMIKDRVGRANSLDVSLK